MAQRGGKRPGAGRPKGAKDRATREAGSTLAELAREHTSAALDTLMKICLKGESESARVAAANALLDRGYGKPPQSLDVSNPDGSMAMPNVIEFVMPEPSDDDADAG